MHLSHVSQMVLEGFLGRIDFAIIEATEITPDGRVYLTTGIGNAPTFLQKADKVIIELNAHHSPRLREMADIIVLPPAAAPPSDPDPRPAGQDRQALRRVDPAKVVGIVHTDESDGGRGFAPTDDVSRRIAAHVSRFLLDEMAAGRIPRGSSRSRAAWATSATPWSPASPPTTHFPQFKVYTEVLQDSMLDLIAAGSVIGASTCSLTLTDDKLEFLYDYFDEFADRIVLRPQEISNNPGIARRLGVIATNTAIEVDIYGHANSTHFFGTQIMNGLGGSGDFERNAYLSIFMCPSVAKGGRISTIVPMCSHVDHSEHSVQMIATEQGLGRPPRPLADRPRQADHRPLRPSRLPRLPAPLSGARPAGAHPPRPAALLRAPRQFPGTRRHAAGCQV